MHRHMVAPAIVRHWQPSSLTACAELLWLSATSNVSRRTASYYWDSQRQLYRNLLKLYGIRFDISVHGQVPSPLQTPHVRSWRPCQWG